MNLQQTIRRILREEDYSPAGKEIIPNKIVIHKSNPMFRDKILQDGLKVRAGECYKIYVGYGIKCRPAIFATNSTNKRAWFDSTYDDDIWEINTEMIPDVKWFKDRHYESRSKHIVTFQDIPREAITLKYKGTGSGDVRTWDKDSPNIVRESIRRILKEELNSYVRRRVDLSDEKVKNQIKQEILSHSNLLKQQDEVVIEFVSDFTTQELLKWFNQEEYDEHYDSVSDYIKENYSDFILEYFHETFKENDDSTYCFIKHSERYGGRGFTECFGSWYSFLNRFGSWLPDVDWNKVQEKLKTENKILLARPLEGHIYEYYFSVLKK